MTKRVFVTPFNSAKKFATVGYKRPDGSVRIVVKGAPDFVVKRCTRVLQAGGNVVDQTQDELHEVVGPQVTQIMTNKMYRTILHAYKDFTAEEWETFVATVGNPSNDDNDQERAQQARDQTENNLIMCAIFGIEDPLRAEIPNTIR